MAAGAPEPEQLELRPAARARVRAARPKAVEPLADDRSGGPGRGRRLRSPHLDRPFDYAVPASMAEPRRPGAGCGCGSPAGSSTASWSSASRLPSTPGTLARLARVVSPEPVLTPEVARPGRAVADRYGGVLADVLRLAVPPRHAAAEAKPLGGRPSRRRSRAGARPVVRYPAGGAFLRAIGWRSAHRRAVWTALPGPTWPAAVAHGRRAATVAAGRGALVVVPDARDVAPGRQPRSPRSAAPAATSALTRRPRARRALPPLPGRPPRAGAVRGRHAGRACSPRSATSAWSVVWDDGDDLHAEPRAPYPHVREVLRLRAAADRRGRCCWAVTP